MSLTFLQQRYQKIQPGLQSLVLLFVRVTCGWNFYLTGKGKLGHLDATTEFFASLSIPAPHANAVMIGSLEMVGGLFLLSGLLTRLISIPLAAAMVVAYATAHREDAFLSLSDFSDQAPFSFLVATLVCMAFGAGRISADHALCPIAKKFFPATLVP